MLVVNNIEVKYSGIILVLKGVSLTVGDGQVVTLLGANGAGKSTTLQAISGLLKAQLGEVTRGTIEYDGVRVDRMQAQDILRSGIAQVLEGRRCFQYLSVAENLRMGAYTRKDARVTDDLNAVYQYFPKLRTLEDRQAGYLSGGEQQMLVIGRAIMTNPKLLLLDEPSLGLSPKLVDEIFEILKVFNQTRHTSILLVEQHARAALDIADYGYVMENGKIVLDGAAADLKHNPDIREFYMGLSSVGENRSYRDVKHYKRRKRWIT